MGEGSYKSAPAAWKRAPTREAGRLEPRLQRGKTPPNPPSPHPCLFQPRGRSPQRPAQLRPRDPQGGSLLGEASFSLLESALRPQRGGWIDLLNGVGGDSEGCGGATRSHSLPRPLYWEGLAELLYPLLPCFVFPFWLSGGIRESPCALEEGRFIYLKLVEGLELEGTEECLKY